MMSRLSWSRRSVGCTLQQGIKSLNLGPSVHKVQIRGHLGGAHHNSNGEEGERIFRLGLAADIGLTVGKAFTGYLSGSTAIIADAAHSLSDVVLSGIALWSYKAGKIPKDKEHPYGHGKFETLGALGISGMLLATSGGIAWHALDILMGLMSSAPDMADQSLTFDHMHGHSHGGHHHGMDMDHPVLALNVTILSIAVKEGLYWITKRAGERQGSGLMKANAWHHRADAVSSIVALIGVGGSILGVKFLDPLAGVVVSGLILKAGIETGYESIMELVDAAISTEQLQPIRRTILEVEGVKGCHRLRGRKAGSFLYLDVHIEVDPFSSVSAAHGIGESVRHHIHKTHPQVAEVFIHIDPSTSEIPSSVVDQQERLRGTVCQKKIDVKDNDVEAVISNIFMMKFSQKVAVEHITHHLLNGNKILEIEVSMPEDMLIRDAMRLAKDAEKEILQAVPNCMQACIQLRLGHSIPRG